MASGAFVLNLLFYVHSKMFLPMMILRISLFVCVNDRASQTQADVRVLNPPSILHSQLAHNSASLSGWPFPLLCEAHTPVQRVKRLAALVHWYVCCFTPLALALH